MLAAARTRRAICSCSACNCVRHEAESHTRRVAFDGVLADVLPPTSAEILHAFGLRVGDLRRHGLGWDSVGWTDGVWFVKVWRYRPPANLPLLEQLELGVSVPVARQT